MYLAEILAIKPTISPNVNRSINLSGYEHIPFRVSFDRAFDSRTSRSASRVIVRDNQGVILEKDSKIFERVSSPFEAAALACRYAVELGVAEGL